MEALTRRLSEAIRNGEIITVVYAGGSQPGTEREILPIKLVKDRLHAECFRAGGRRTFDVSKLTVVGSAETAASLHGAAAGAAVQDDRTEFADNTAAASGGHGQRKKRRVASRRGTASRRSASPPRTEMDDVAHLVGMHLAVLPVQSVMSERAITVHHPEGDGSILAGIGKRRGPGRSPWHVIGPDGRRQRFGAMDEAANAFLALAQWAAADPRPPVPLSSRPKIVRRAPVTGGQRSAKWRLSNWKGVIVAVGLLLWLALLLMGERPTIAS